MDTVPMTLEAMTVAVPDDPFSPARPDGAPALNGPIDFSSAPFTIIWEVTRSCGLRCVHCRAAASESRHPLELTTREGFRLLDQVHDLRSPVSVFTGGDPLRREDLFELIEYSVARGISTAVTPSGTPLLTQAAVRRMRDLGVRRMALSLDGPTPEVHDRFRQQPGSYDWTVAGIRHAVACGLPVQVNTTVTRSNVALLSDMARRVEELGAVMWSVFLLVTVGRAQASQQLSAEEFEGVFAQLYDISRSAPFAVRTTAAPHYRRYVLQRRREEKHASGRPLPPAQVAGMVPDMARAPRGVTDGNGLLFISHTGEVCPSGFLPIVAGNIRQQPLAEIYRQAPIFQLLRDVDQFQGKCGRCEFVRVCGGSRARAYATTGNPMAQEPYCTYEPRRAEATAADTDRLTIV
jgi:radical SAM protein